MSKFTVHSSYDLSGDQGSAVDSIVKNINNKAPSTTLLGVTGSGKTFTVAKTIERLQRPAIIMAHNKILAAQLYKEMKSYFPNNAVEYFISTFDYYQPEAYVPSSDSYIDKDSSTNPRLEQLKTAAIHSILERKDIIVVASVSAIYSIGEKDNYSNLYMYIEVGQHIPIKDLISKLVELHYLRNDIALDRATFSVQGDIINIHPAHMDERLIRISFFGDEIEKIELVNYINGHLITGMRELKLYSASLFATPRGIVEAAIPKIRAELKERIQYFKDQEKYLEAQRIEERTNLDLEMMITTGYCKGIENYSVYMSKRLHNRPATVFDYLPEDALIFVDESHVSVPQIMAMFKGDRSRKEKLVQYGFRLPTCLENRPLTFEEWDGIRGQTVFISATPANWEVEQSKGEVIEQVIRPTFVIDPKCYIRPTRNQVDDLMNEAQRLKKENLRLLAVTLTKKDAEQLTNYLNENNIAAKYMHADTDAIERIEIIRNLRLGKFDVLVGINLLREGLDIPECGAVAVLDADKEGFLRSATALIQTIGRAARNNRGIAILYADKVTPSMQAAIDEGNRRREKQEAYNKLHNKSPQSTNAGISESFYNEEETAEANSVRNTNIDTELLDRFHKIPDITKEINKQKQLMKKHAENLEFEESIKIRNYINKLADILHILDK